MCPAPNAPPVPDEHRALIGGCIAQRYSIEGVVGVGAMATVFRARHIALQREVAVKVQTSMTAQFCELDARFVREAEILSMLDHPHCVRALDCGRTESGLRFLVMPLIEGVELGDLLGVRHDPRLVVRRARQILAGLAHAHGRGVVHRDLKPENILVTQDHRGEESIQIVDFGIGRLSRNNDPRMTEPGLVLGTPEYISPEQADGRGADARSDLYALGCIMFEMLQGCPPFDDDDPDRLLRDHMHTSAPKLGRHVPPALRAVVAKLLEKDPDRRFPSAAAAARALPPLDRPVTVAMRTHDDDQKRTARTRPRRRGFSYAAAGLVLVVGIAAGLLRPHADRVEPPPGPSLFEAAIPVIDRLLAQDQIEDARVMAERLLDLRPDDAALLWRSGRAHAALGEPATALERYRDAARHRPALLDDLDFFHELVELLRKPKNRDRAVTIAIRDVDHCADRFLAELVNDASAPLPFSQRRRVLEHLRARPESAAWVDEPVQLNLDLAQASASVTPCLTYAAAVHEIASAKRRSAAEIAATAPAPRASNAFDRMACVAVAASVASPRYRS